MGLLEVLRFREPRQPSLTRADLQAAAEADKKADRELGISGTVAYSGRIHTGDPRTNLQWEQAFGSPGIANWGAWETLVNTDHAASTALEMVAAPLRDAELGVEAAGEDEASARIASLVRDALVDWLDPLWPQFVQEAVQGFLTYGHDVHEIVWGTRHDERVPGGQAVYVAKLAQRLPGSIKSDGWKEDDKGELATIVQAGLRGGKWVQDIPIPADKVLLFRWNARGNNWLGTSAFRPVYYLTKVREALVKIVAIGHERESLGVPVVKPGESASITEDEKASLQEFVENIHAHENSGIVLPRDVDLSWVFTPGANKGHVLDAWERLGLAIHEQFFAQQMYLGTSGTGSRSVGEVHADAKEQFVRGVKTVLESVLNGVGSRPYTGLVGKLVRANFGEVKKLPKVVLTLKRAEVDLGELGSSMPALISAGAITWTAKDENNIRERTGLGPIDEDERATLQAERQAKAAEIAGAQGLKGDGDRDGQLNEAGDSKNGPPAKSMADVVRLADRAPWQPRRPLLLEEQHVAWPDIDAFLTSARDTFETDARDIITEMVAGALPQIREAMADGDPSELATVQLDTSKLASYVEGFIEKARRVGYRHVAQERRTQPKLDKRPKPLKFAAEEEKDDAAPALEPDEAPPVDVSGKVRQLVESMRDRLIRRMRSRVIDDIQSEAEYLARTGGDPEAIVARVVETALETRGLKFDAGSVVTHAYSMGRQEFIEAHGDEVLAMQLSAILDRGTCEYCRQLDGTQFELGSEEHAEMTPPLRLCDGQDLCRCVLIGIFAKD